MRKNMKSIRNDEAVSPVIGVILMVAITVILAAVIGVFVFQMPTPTKTPMVNMKFVRAQVGTGNITLSQVGGEAITLSDVKLIVYNSSSYKTTVNPLLAIGTTTVLPSGAELVLNFTTNTTLAPYGLATITIDGTPYTNFGTQTYAGNGYAGNGYHVAIPGDAVHVEFWYIPSQQMLGKVDGATIS